MIPLNILFTEKPLKTDQTAVPSFVPKILGPGLIF